MQRLSAAAVVAGFGWGDGSFNEAAAISVALPYPASLCCPAACAALATSPYADLIASDSTGGIARAAEAAFVGLRCRLEGIAAEGPLETAVAVGITAALPPLLHYARSGLPLPPSAGESSVMHVCPRYDSLSLLCCRTVLDASAARGWINSSAFVCLLIN
jgi:hypothetical protein